MVSATSSPPRKPLAPAELALAVERQARPVWVLAVGTDAFAHVAWQRGRDVALALEFDVCTELQNLVADVLEDGDAVVHAPSTALFGIALLESSTIAQGATSHALSAEKRTMLASIERAVRECVSVDVHVGWTLVGIGDDVERGLSAAAERGRSFIYRREFATLLHDLTTPVSSIYGSLVAATDGVLPAATAERFLSIARSEAGRVGRLIRGFLTAQDDDVRACDAFGAIDRAMSSLEPLALARDVTVQMCKRSGHVAAALNEDRLITILVSLFENAIKHGKRGGLVKARSLVDGEYVCIEVDDDGPGIPEDSFDRIFQFGARASDAEGSGIGLAHARLLVVTAGGDISASRSPLGGARFTVRLPLLEARA